MYFLSDYRIIPLEKLLAELPLQYLPGHFIKHLFLYEKLAFFFISRQPVQLLYVGKLRPPENVYLSFPVRLRIGQGLSHNIKISLFLHQLHGNDSPPCRKMLLNVHGMAGSHHRIVAVIIQVVVLHLAFQSGVGIGVAFNFNSAKQIRRHHHHVRPRLAHGLFLQDSHFPVNLLEKFKKRLPDIFIV